MKIKDYLTDDTNFLETKAKITNVFMENYANYRKKNKKTYLTRIDYYVVISDTVTSLLNEIKTEGIKV